MTRLGIVALFGSCLLATGCPATDDDGNDTDAMGSGTAVDESGGEATDGRGPDLGQAEGSSDTGTVMNGCGTFDADEPGDSTIPQDPDDPEVLAACAELCAAAAGDMACNTDASACVELCKVRSCDVCPGTLAPLVSCMAEAWPYPGCNCPTDNAWCPPTPCMDEDDATTQCGG